MMSRYTLFFSVLLVALSPNHLPAQNIKWNSAPKTGFVFQISNNDAQKLLTKSSPDTIISSLLHTQIDTFSVLKGWTNRPEKGHFILVSVNENKLHCEYTCVFPYQVLLLKEYNALSLQILDLEGNIRQDSKVKFKTRRIPFDKKTNTYRIENEWFNTSSKVVTVELEGFRSVFNIQKHEAPSWSNDYYNYDDGPDFYSYMITDKNRYKPGERVKFKSYALSGSRNPIRKSVEVWLIKSGQPVKVGTATPHRPGSFAGEIQLHDSLKLTLDKYYTLQLRDKGGRVVANCGFKYEDYDLHGNKLEVKLETETQFFPASNYVKVKATNENGLMLKDARAFVTVSTENIREIFQPLVVLPDTLLYREMVLNPDGETVVEIPSSFFKKSNTGYYVAVSVLNSENRRMEAGARASHYFSQYELNATYSYDSIFYQVLDKGVPMKNVPFKLYRDEAIDRTDIILPHKEKINPAMTTIRLQSTLVSRTIRFADMVPKIKFVGGIQKDSFNISIDNPQKLLVSSFVYQGSNLLQKEFGSEVEFKSKVEDRNNSYYVELLYSFGGSEHVVSKEFEFREGALDISLDLPERVYPGQKVDVNIDVKDDEGNPVSGVDLTALATTAKLNYYLPDLPYYGSKSGGRPDNATYRKNEFNKRIADLDLDFDKWAPLLRLDTMTYYQFTYPANKFFYHHLLISDSTQFAPYVMQGGAAKQIYVVEVDHVPVYFSWTSHPKANAFYIEPDKYKQITLRLYDRVIILDSMCLERGKKTIFSVDLDHLPKGVTVHKIPPEIVKAGLWRRYKKWVFTKTEIGRYGPYLAQFSVGDKPTYLESSKQFVALSWGNNMSDVIAGPVTQGMQTYVQEGNVKTTYQHAGGFSYVFEDNIVYKKDVTKLFRGSFLTCRSDP